MNCIDYMKELAEFRNGKTMTGSEITKWVFSRLNCDSPEVRTFADSLRDRYIDVKYPLSSKVWYNVRGGVDRDRERFLAWMFVERDLDKSPRRQ